MIRLGGISKVKIICLLTLFALLLSGCGSTIAAPYASSVLSSEVAGRGYTADLKADSFAKDLCVVTGDIPVPGLEMANNIEAVLLVDVNHASPMAAVNAHRPIHPASTTKLMTALLALENCSMDEKLVLGGFEVAGEDHAWHTAQASVDWNSNDILVHSEEVPSPVAVRYAWHNWPAGANVVTDNGLPLPPFRSVSW